MHQADHNSQPGAVLRLYGGVRAALALCGVAALIAVALPAPRELLVRKVAALAAPAEPAPEPTSVTAGPIQVRAVSDAAAREQRLLAEFVARRYRVADEAATLFVSTAYRAGREHSVDPLLVLAVMAIESRYNPVAESVVGAKGLMQIIPKFHLDKLTPHGGEPALLDPVVNIQVGTEILREYMRRFGDTETALQMYAGAFDEPTAQYAGKVFAEKARLQQHLARQRREA